jgi:hypothetical protein
MLRKCLGAVIRVKRRLSVRDVSEVVGITVISCHTILTEKVEVPRVAAKCVPRHSLDNQKANRVTVSRELSGRSNSDENFLQNVITGDKTCVFG